MPSLNTPHAPWQDTPLFRYFTRHHDMIRNGQYYFSHLSDFMRLALLYKHGGLYFDAGESSRSTRVCGPEGDRTPGHRLG